MNERLKIFANYLILYMKVKSNADLALKLGIAKSQFSEILSGKRKLSLDLVNKVHSVFPELNTEWVMTGEGQMLNNDAVSVSSPKSNPAEDYSSLKQIIQTQSVAINALNKTAEMQEAELKRKDIDIKSKESEILRLKAEIQRLQRANEELEAKN